MTEKEIIDKLKAISLFEFEIDEYGTLAMAYYSIQDIIKEYDKV